VRILIRKSDASPPRAGIGPRRDPSAVAGYSLFPVPYSLQFSPLYGTLHL
jgi:hypothetical protein